MRYFTLILFFIVHYCAFSQHDSIVMQELVITATKTERSLQSLPMPVSLIKAREISLTGSSRLQDILTEHSGLSVVPQVNGIGNGLQIQGLNPDYTMILIDGEPLIGRFTGSLELNRVSLGNIKKIEVVKGPSSSLYGSEALGGVVNIITKTPEYDKLQANLRYSSHNTLDASLNTFLAKKKFSATLFGNFFRTDGFDLFPQLFGQTVAPYHNITIHAKTKYTFSENHIVQFNAKSYSETQDNFYQVISAQDSIKVNGITSIQDFSMNPQYKVKLADKVYVNTSVYGSVYKTKTNLFKNESNVHYYTDTFQQAILKPEIQTSCYFAKNQKWTAGAGIAYETVETSRYANSQQRTQNTKYFYGQHEWSIRNDWELVSGMRYDHNTIYGSQWSPKLALQYSGIQNWIFKASIGTGFKSPDFRYLYLNFRNAAGGYSVFGTNELKDEINQLINKGVIEELLYDINDIGTLDAETSFAVNTGIQYTYAKDCHIELNVFRNDLKGLIETQAIALTKDRKTIYSYSNIKSAYTQGFDVTIRNKFKYGFSVELSAQLLYAKDKELLNQIDAGNVYGRDPVTKESYRIHNRDYFGLYNRSRHTETLKLFYENKKHNWNANLRLIYKSKFGISGTAGSVQGAIRPSSDVNGNAILDRYDNFVDGYFIWNLSASKTIFQSVTIQTGIENVLDYTDPERIPGLQGRVVFLSVNYTLF
jgi:outer membrane receptor for ferrienterochelin and colicins